MAGLAVNNLFNSKGAGSAGFLPLYGWRPLNSAESSILGQQRAIACMTFHQSSGVCTRLVWVWQYMAEGIRIRTFGHWIGCYRATMTDQCSCFCVPYSP